MLQFRRKSNLYFLFLLRFLASHRSTGPHNQVTAAQVPQIASFKQFYLSFYKKQYRCVSYLKDIFLKKWQLLP